MPIRNERRTNDEGVTRIHHGSVFVLPKLLDVAVSSQQEAQLRYVGIYSVPVFIADVQLAASFDLEAQRGLLAARFPERTLLWQQATLRLPMGELRSLRELSGASFAGEALSFSPLSKTASSLELSALEAPLRLQNVALENGTERKFELRLKMAGSREVAVIPVGSTTQVRMRSDWPHPSFQGALLPASLRRRMAPGDPGRHAAGACCQSLTR